MTILQFLIDTWVSGNIAEIVQRMSGLCATDSRAHRFDDVIAHSRRIGGNTSAGYDDPISIRIENYWKQHVRRYSYDVDDT